MGSKVMDEELPKYIYSVAFKPSRARKWRLWDIAFHTDPDAREK